MKKILLFFACAAITVLFFSSCEKPKAKTLPLIICSIPPYAYFAERIAGDGAEIKTLIPLGANPHLFEPTLSQVESTASAAAWIRSGEPFENKIYQVLKERNPNILVIDITQGIHLLAHKEDSHDLDDHACAGHSDSLDRHIWLSPRLAQKQAETIASALTLRYPENAGLYEQKKKLLVADLEAVDRETSALLSPFKGDAILVSHPAFGYFCENYNLIQLSIECEGKDPLPQHLASILDQAKKYHVRSILTLPQYNNQGAVLIAERLRLPIHMIDPYSGDYLTNLRILAQTIAYPEK